MSARVRERAARPPRLRRRRGAADREDAGLGAAARPADWPGTRRDRLPPAPDRHAAPPPGAEGRAHQPAQLAPRRVEPRSSGGRAGTPDAVRAAAHVRELRDRRPTPISTFEIARMMGTSVEQIEKTYGHLLPDALDRGRAALESFDTADSEAFGRRMGAEE